MYQNMFVREIKGKNVKKNKGKRGEYVCEIKGKKQLLFNSFYFRNIRLSEKYPLAI